MTTTPLHLATHPTPRAGAVIASLRGASKTFGSGDSAVRAVDGVDISVGSGELLAVLSPNGAGKSTAISLLTGLAWPAPPAGRPSCSAATPVGCLPASAWARWADLGGAGDSRVGELLRQFRGYYPDPRPMGAVIDAAGLGGLERRLFGDSRAVSSGGSGSG